jgi:hypothetical protein
VLRWRSPLIREGTVAESLHVGSPNEHHHAKLDPITISNTRIGAALSLLATVTHYPDCQAPAFGSELRLGRTRTAELPLFRRSITPRALTWKSRRQPSSRASTLLTGYFPYL